MNTNFERLNDGSNHPPRLRVQHTMWSLIGLPMNAPTEWTLDEKFGRAREAGFEAVECWLTDDNQEEVVETLRRYDLRLVLGHRPFSLEDVRKTLDKARSFNADFVFAQPASASTPLEQVIEIVREGRKMANEQGIPFFVETHRGNFTENLPQARQLIEAVPDIRMTGDLSHGVVVGEFYGWASEGAAAQMSAVLERVSHLHGRISNGEAVQVDVGDGSNETAQFFVKLWTIAMRNWLQGASNGDFFHSAASLARLATPLPCPMAASSATAGNKVW